MSRIDPPGTPPPDDVKIDTSGGDAPSSTPKHTVCDIVNLPRPGEVASATVERLMAAASLVRLIGFLVARCSLVKAAEWALRAFPGPQRTVGEVRQLLLEESRLDGIVTSVVIGIAWRAKRQVQAGIFPDDEVNANARLRAMARDLTRPNANRVAGPLFPLPRGTDAPSAPLPDKVAADRDLVTKALAEIERLPPAQQAVMVMTVTAALAENAGAVLRLSARERQLLVRARRTLRARFGVTTRLRNSVPA